MGRGVPMRVYGWQGGDMSIMSGMSFSKNDTGRASILRYNGREPPRGKKPARTA